MEPTDTFTPIIERLKLCYGTRNIRTLLEQADIPKGTYDSWKHRDRIPQRKLIGFAEHLGVRLEWLTNGTLPKYRVEPIPEAEIEPPAAPEPHPLSVQLFRAFEAVPDADKKALFEKIMALVQQDK